MKKYLPPLVCGFSAGVLSIVPLVKSFSCCLIIPAASYFTLLLYVKSNRMYNERILPSRAVLLGLLTGIFAALFSTGFDTLITFISRPDDLQSAVMELEKMLGRLPSDATSKQMMDMMYKMADDVSRYGFSALYTASMLLSSLILDSLFGMIGALIGMQIINNRIDRPAE